MNLVGCVAAQPVFCRYGGAAAPPYQRRLMGPHETW